MVHITSGIVILIIAFIAGTAVEAQNSADVRGGSAIRGRLIARPHADEGWNSSNVGEDENLKAIREANDNAKKALVHHLAQLFDYLETSNFMS